MTSFKASYQPSRPLICGDLDAPVADDCSISPGLGDDIVLETLGLEQHARSPIQNDTDSGPSTRSHHHGSTLQYSRCAGHRLRTGVGSPTHPCISRHHLITLHPGFVSLSHHCPHQPRTRILAQIRSSLT